MYLADTPGAVVRCALLKWIGGGMSKCYDLGIPAKQFFEFTGDVTKTVQLEISQLETVQSPTTDDLFGSWIESGDEDEQLEELYKSRLRKGR